MRGLLLGSALVLLGALPASAATVYSNDFSSGLNGFSAGTTESSAPGNEVFLSNFGSAGTQLNLSGLAANSAVTVTFTLDVIGSEDGNGPEGGGADFFKVSLNGASAFNENFANYQGANTQSYGGPGLGGGTYAPGTGAAGTGTLGYSGFPGGTRDSIYSLTVTGLTNSSGVLAVLFQDLSNQNRSDEYYGIDNVTVQGTLAPAPIPAALPLFASALGGLGFVGWRRRKPRA